MATVERSARLPGVRCFVREAQRDARGEFRRIFSASEYAPFGITDTFVEDNVSVSKRGVLRGLHFDMRLAKFVQVLEGEVFDVVVDVRRESPAFGAWEAFRLTARGCEQLYVPRGFAHGFYVVSDSAILSYKQTAPYDPNTEGQVRWNDPRIGVAWPFEGEPLLSEKDRVAAGLEQFER